MESGEGFAVDFVEWADTILRALVDLSRELDGGHTYGVHESQLAGRLSSTAVTDQLHAAVQRDAMFDALLSLESIGLVQGTNKLWCTVTRAGRAHATDPLPIWQAVCAEKLDPEEDELLRLINRLSPDPSESYVRLRGIEYSAVARELSQPNAIHSVHEWGKTLGDGNCTSTPPEWPGRGVSRGSVNLLARWNATSWVA